MYYIYIYIYIYIILSNIALVINTSSRVENRTQYKNNQVNND